MRRKRGLCLKDLMFNHLILAISAAVLGGPTLDLEHGTRSVQTPDYTLRLANDTGIAIGLSPPGVGVFEFKKP